MRTKTVRCKSGEKGWQDNLQNVYADFEEFEAYALLYNQHIRLGFKTIRGAWKSNPVVQGSTNPADYSRVKKVKNKS